MKLTIQDPERKVYDCVSAVYEILEERPEIPAHILPFIYYPDRVYYEVLSEPPAIFSEFDSTPTFQKVEGNTFIYYTSSGRGKYTFSPDGTITFEGRRGSFFRGCSICRMSIIWERADRLAVAENIHYAKIKVRHPWGMTETFCFYDVEIETYTPWRLF